MTLCHQCGASISQDEPLCRHHYQYIENDWAVRNRTMCDLIHRGITPPPVTVEINVDS